MDELISSNSKEHETSLLYDDILPAGDHAVIHKAKRRIQRIVLGAKRTDPAAYYMSMAYNISATINESRGFIVYRAKDVIQTAAYWYLASDKSDTLLNVMQAVKKSMSLYKSGDTSDISRRAFPLSIIVGAAHASTIEAIIMVSSLGFIVDGIGSVIRMPKYTELKFIDACLEVAVNYYSKELLTKMKLPESAIYPRNETTIRTFKNRAYLTGLTTLRNFSRTPWVFFRATDDAHRAINRSLVPEDAPGWFEDVLYSVDIGMPTTSTEDTIEYSTEALEAKHDAEKKVLNDLIAKQQEIIRNARAFIRSAAEQQAQLRGNLAMLKEELDRCNAAGGETIVVETTTPERRSEREIEVLGDESNGTTSGILSEDSKTSTLAGAPPQAPPAPTFKVYRMAVQRGSQDIAKAMSNLNSSASSISEAAAVIDSTPDVRVEMLKAKKAGQDALLSDIRRGVSLKKVAGPSQRPSTPERKRESRDLAAALREQLEIRARAIHTTVEPSGTWGTGTFGNVDMYHQDTWDERKTYLPPIAKYTEKPSRSLGKKKMVYGMDKKSINDDFGDIL